MKKRKDLPEKYKWDLSKIYANDEAFEKDLQKCEKMAEKYDQYRGKLGNPDSFLELFKLGDQFSVIDESLQVYAGSKADEDLRVGSNQERSTSFQSRALKMYQKMGFVEEEIKNLPKEYLQSLIEDVRFKEYKLELINYIRLKDHFLSEKENRISNLMGLFAGGFSKVFKALVNADLKFEPVIDKNGKKHTLTNSNVSTFYMNKDRSIRKQAAENVKKAYKSVQNTLAANYISSLKKDWAITQIDNFDNTLQRLMYPDNMSQDVYDTLIENVRKHISLSDKYCSIRKRILGIPDYSRFDDFVPLTKFNKNYTYEQSHELVVNALSVLGKDYVDLLKKSVTERWIDVFPTEGKRGGGYSTGAYNTHPYILLNFEGKLDDVLTLAHELGHSIHSYYSSHNCEPSNWDYSILCAEVASTVNEVLTLKYLYNNAKTKEEKIHYINQYISEFTGTVFTQALFSMFEHKAHELIEKNLPISREVLTKEYKKLSDMFDKGKRNRTGESWMRIPHFYSCYYVYKYCVGFLSAVCIAKNILEQKEGALEEYKNFLKNGGKDFSLDTLKIAGIDLTSDKPYETAFADMQWAVKELDKLTKE